MKHQIKVFKLLRILGVLALALPVLTPSLSHAEPQTTPSDHNQENGEQNLLNYLQAIEALEIMPEDIPVEFKAGTNDPVHIGALPDDTGTPAKENVIIQGFVDQNGQPHNFTPRILIQVFRDAPRNGGQLLINMTSEIQKNLLADAQDVFFEAKRIPVIDLIVLNPQNRRRYMVRRVNVNAVHRVLLMQF